MTRLRVNVKNIEIINIESIKQIKDVLGVIVEGEIQIVLGPGKAKKALTELKDKYNIEEAQLNNNWEDNKSQLKEHNQKSRLKRGLKTISSIFIPMIPGIIAAGLLLGIASLLSTMQLYNYLPSNDLWNLIILFCQLSGNAFMAYFAIYTGVYAAKAFGATEVLGGMVGAISIGSQINEISQILGLYNYESHLDSILIAGKGGIIGVIFGVWILSKIEKWCRTWVPDALDLILTPLISIITVGILMIFILMPTAGFISDFIVTILSLLLESEYKIVTVIAGFILAATFLPLVLLGLHHGLIPIYAVQLAETGGVTLFPILVMAGAGQVGASIAIYRKAKKLGFDDFAKITMGGIPAGILGVGEPLIYGVTLPLGKPFITAGLGAGIAGAFVALMNVTSTSWGPSGIVAIPLMQASSIIYFIIGLIIAYVSGFIITTIFYKEEEMKKTLS